MIIIFTLDDQNGTNLAGKRQSSDRVVADRILTLAGNHLRINQKTMSFWKNNDNKPSEDTIIDTNYAFKQDDMYFAEEPVASALMESAEKIYVFRWNRRYPSMSNARVNLQDYHREVLEEFPGYSHEKITLEVYTK